jgi:hypothetical protein
MAESGVGGRLVRLFGRRVPADIIGNFPEKTLSLLQAPAQRFDEPFEAFTPLVWAAACASGGKGGVMVSQKRTNRARVSAVIARSRSIR